MSLRYSIMNSKLQYTIHQKEFVSNRLYNPSDLEFMPIIDPISLINNLILPVQV